MFTQMATGGMHIQLLKQFAVRVECAAEPGEMVMESANDPYLLFHHLTVTRCDNQHVPLTKNERERKRLPRFFFCLSSISYVEATSKPINAFRALFFFFHVKPQLTSDETVDAINFIYFPLATHRTH